MIQTGRELAAMCKRAATQFKTLYVRGCFGAPMNSSNKKRYTNNHTYNKEEDRTQKILSASQDTFGFDCVCFIKGLLWGWEGDAGHVYGGAKYQANGVPDITADSMIKVCKEVSEDFSAIAVGEAVWIPGHIGIYVGDGMAVECTHRWFDGVQLTAVHNIAPIPGMNGRSWQKHGKLPWITYDAKEPVISNAVRDAVTVLAREVIAGRFGNGEARKEKLYRMVQDRVNQLCREGKA